MSFGSFLKKGLKIAAPIAGAAFGGPLGGFAASALTRGIGTDDEKKKRRRQAMATGPGAPPSAREMEFDRMVTDGRERAGRLTGEYDSAVTGYDPREYAKGTADAMMESYGELADHMEGGRRMSTNRRGFIGSPMGMASQTRDINTRVARDIGSRSMDAAGMELSRIGQVGAAGERATDRAMESTFDRYATERADLDEERRRREEEKASKRSMWANLGGAALGAAGQVLAARRGGR